MLTPALALSAVKSLLRFQGQLDSILALQETAAELPFALPPAPVDTATHLEAMFEYFEGEQGALILELNDLEAEYAAVQTRPHAPQNQEARRRVFQLFYEASDVLPVRLGPQQPARVRADGGLRLSYYVVSSARLSKNPTAARILLATADTLLEFLGENATTLVSNPKTAAIVGTVLDEFAIKRDFDDEGAEEIFRSLLGSLLVAVTVHGQELSDEPIVGALVGALSDVRAELGDDFVAKIISSPGFEGFLGRFVAHVADDPELLPDDPRLRAVLVATLKDIEAKVPQLLEDPKGLLGVLEVSATAAAAQVESLLEGKLSNRPLIPKVLVALAGKVEELGQGDALFKAVASGAVFEELFRTALTTIAEDPDGLATSAKVNQLVASLVSQVADLLAHEDLGQIFTTQTLAELSSRSLAVLAEHPSALGLDHAFASGVVTGVIKASASAVQDGLSLDDVYTLTDAALTAAFTNLRLLELDASVLAILEAAGASLAEDGVRSLLSPEGRKDVLLETLAVLAANPAVWGKFEAAGLVQPVVQAVIQGLADDPSKLLSGDVLVTSIRRVLTAVALRGGQLIDGQVSSETLQTLLHMALKSAQAQIGIAIDGENLPEFLERVVRGFLKAPFELSTLAAQPFKSLVGGVLDDLESLAPQLTTPQLTTP